MRACKRESNLPHAAKHQAIKAWPVRPAPSTRRPSRASSCLSTNTNDQPRDAFYYDEDQEAKICSVHEFAVPNTGRSRSAGRLPSGNYWPTGKARALPSFAPVWPGHCALRKKRGGAISVGSCCQVNESMFSFAMKHAHKWNPANPSSLRWSGEYADHIQLQPKICRKRSSQRSPSTAQAFSSHGAFQLDRDRSLVSQQGGLVRVRETLR